MREKEQAAVPASIPTFPQMILQVTPGGVLVTILRSLLEKQEILLPSLNCDSMAIEWLQSRPSDVKDAAVQRLTGFHVANNVRKLN